MKLFFFSSRRRHTRFDCDWSSDVCSSDLREVEAAELIKFPRPEGKPIGDSEVGRNLPGNLPVTLARLEPRRRNANGLLEEIGRASCRKECRSRWSPHH